MSVWPTRRAVLGAAVLAGASACRQAPSKPAASRVNLTARPRPVASSSLQPGTSTIDLSNGRQGLVHVPGGAVRGLVVALHGAGGQAGSGLDLLRVDADRLGLVVLAPASAGSTWAALHGGPDPDTPAVDTALTSLLRAHRFDPAAVAVAGFSDGASYALTLGLANGTLFLRVVAFSPGFQVADRRQGRPEFFITHGIHDEVLPIGRTSRRLVPALREDGYAVTYLEFDGGHVLPGQYVAEAAEWILR
jgi:phospholipase/carboxylesterase